MTDRRQELSPHERLYMVLRQRIFANLLHSSEAATQFFTAHVEKVALACLAMARRFHRGGRLLVFANGGMTTDAQHISVEFVHPVIMGKKALPALSLTNDIAVVTGITKDMGYEAMFSQQVQVLGAPDDIAMGLSADGNCANVLRALEIARGKGLLSIGIAGGAAGKMAQSPAIDYCLLIPSSNPLVVQEIVETLYHILWEQVQIFLAQKGWLDEPQGEVESAAEADRFSKLFYPFLHTEEPAPLEAVLAAMRHSTLEKAREVVDLRWQVCESSADTLVRAAAVMTRAFSNGQKLLAFGNGGSATDAQALSADFVHPPIAGRKALPAMSLTNDIAVVTALANDVGFENIFARQLLALGQPGDIALGISTSGNSDNLLAAFATAKRLGLLTIGLAGYDGGNMARADTVDYCFVVPSSLVHRIQEVQATIRHTLWELVHHLLERGAEYNVP